MQIAQAGKQQVADRDVDGQSISTLTQLVFGSLSWFARIKHAKKSETHTYQIAGCGEVIFALLPSSVLDPTKNRIKPQLVDNDCTHNYMIGGYCWTMSDIIFPLLISIANRWICENKMEMEVGTPCSVKQLCWWKMNQTDVKMASSTTSRLDQRIWLFVVYTWNIHTFTLTFT